MIGKVTVGHSAGAAVGYVFGPGRHHHDPHIVAGFRPARWLEPPLRPDGRPDVRDLAELLTQPVAALRHRGQSPLVWRCSLRNSPEDRPLSDAEWAEIATEVVDRTGLARRGDPDAARWIAVRHAADHIHIICTRARLDATRAWAWRGFTRVREVCLEAEARHGLRPTAPGGHTASAWPSRGEIEQRAFPQAPRYMLREIVRAAAVIATGEPDYLDRLRSAGILILPRHGPSGELRGHSVAVPGHVDGSGTPYWFGGGTLAPDLSLPKLRHRWAHRGPVPAEEDRSRDLARYSMPNTGSDLWRRAAGTVRESTTELRRLTAAGAGPALATAADLAWAAADLLCAVSFGFPDDAKLRRAARFYDQASREPNGRLPAPGRRGDLLRGLARDLMRAAEKRDPARCDTRPLMAVLPELIAAAADLRVAQQRPSQAFAAGKAARYLRAAAGHTPLPRPGRIIGLGAFLQAESPHNAATELARPRPPVTSPKPDVPPRRKNTPEPPERRPDIPRP